MSKSIGTPQTIPFIRLTKLVTTSIALSCGISSKRQHVLNWQGNYNRKISSRQDIGAGSSYENSPLSLQCIRDISGMGKW